jgi:hypothetical protein
LDDIMNGENDRSFHTPALDGIAASPSPRRYSGTLFSAHLWLLAAFIAMSLFAVAVKSLISGDEPRAVSAVMAIAGVALFPVAWRNVARLLDRAEGEDRPDARSAPRAGAAARSGEQLQLALHR